MRVGHQQLESPDALCSKHSQDKRTALSTLAGGGRSRHLRLEALDGGSRLEACGRRVASHVQKSLSSVSALPGPFFGGPPGLEEGLPGRASPSETGCCVKLYPHGPRRLSIGQNLHGMLSKTKDTPIDLQRANQIFSDTWLPTFALLRQAKPTIRSKRVGKDVSTL